jgi:hypothetical protein
VLVLIWFDLVLCFGLGFPIQYLLLTSVLCSELLEDHVREV